MMLTVKQVLVFTVLTDVTVKKNKETLKAVSVKGSRNAAKSARYLVYAENTVCRCEYDDGTGELATQAQASFISA